LFKHYFVQAFRRCFHDNELRIVLSFCYGQACGEHFSRRKTVAKFFNVVSVGISYLEMFLYTIRVAKVPTVG